MNVRSDFVHPVGQNEIDVLLIDLLLDRRNTCRSVSVRVKLDGYPDILLCTGHKQFSAPCKPWFPTQTRHLNTLSRSIIFLIWRNLS